MLNLEFARDLLFTGALFGFVAFIWAGWAHERPPKGVVWRVVLVAIQAGGLALLGFGLPPLIRNWRAPSALVPGSVPLVWYIVITWLEIIAIAVTAVILIRRKRTELIAPPVVIVVGVHFAPLAFVFGQPILLLAAGLLVVIGIVALRLPRAIAAPSFWCGILAGPVFIVLGVFSLVAGQSALAA
jgi:hypothetical protein